MDLHTHIFKGGVILEERIPDFESSVSDDD